jgi:hypothetical protein
LRRRLRRCNSSVIDDDVIAREEVVGLLFNVSDIALSLSHIEEMLGGDDGGGEEEEADEG